MLPTYIKKIFFAKMLAKYPNMKTIVFCQFFFKWKWCSMKKAATLVCNSDRSFSWRQLWYFCKQQKCFMCSSHYVTLSIKKSYWTWRFNKNFFLLLNQGHSRAKTGFFLYAFFFFFFSESVGVKNTITIGTVKCHCLGLC